MEESLQGPINPALFENGYFGGECLEQENNNASGYCNGSSSYRMFGNNKYRFSFEEEEAEADLRIQGFDNNMSFLQMLQSVGSNNKTQNILHQTQNQNFFLHPASQMATPIWASDVLDTQSPQLSEITNAQTQHPYLISGVNSDFNFQQTNSSEKPTSPAVETKCPASTARKRRKRNQTKPPKDKVEVESQRMTHIAVERNRRRQMNDYLSALRSLMPPSYVQRGDQASIIGGAINFVKELEQILESLQDRKRMRKLSSEEGSSTSTISANTNTTGGDEISKNNEEKEDEEEEERGRVKVKVTVVQKHVNLKITIASNGEKRGAGEVVRAIVEFQRLRLTVLHLNITSLQSSVHYSFSLKIEDDCNLESADEISGVVHQIFSFINAG